MKRSSQPCTGKGLSWKEGIFGVHGRFLSPAEQTWGKGQLRPSQTQPHGSWGPQIRQTPNVSSCWAGKMILNNSPINRLWRGGTEQDGVFWPPSSGWVSENVFNVMGCPREGRSRNNSLLCCKETAASRVGPQELPEVGNGEENLASGLDQHELCWRRCRVLPHAVVPRRLPSCLCQDTGLGQASLSRLAPYLGKLEQQASVDTSPLIPHLKKL